MALVSSLNPDNGRQLHVTVGALPNDNMSIELLPLLDVRVQFAMNQVQDAFEELPDFMLDETISIRMDNATTPTLETISEEENSHDIFGKMIEESCGP